LMFLNIQIDWIILNTYDQQFTLTTKKSLHIIFKIALIATINFLSCALIGMLSWVVQVSSITWDCR